MSFFRLVMGLWPHLSLEPWTVGIGNLPVCANSGYCILVYCTLNLSSEFPLSLSGLDVDIAISSEYAYQVLNMKPF